MNSEITNGFAWNQSKLNAMNSEMTNGFSGLLAINENIDGVNISLNAISTDVSNNNQLLNNISNDISGINTTLTDMNTKLDHIINMMSEVKNVSELNIDDLADAYKEYYENNSVNLQQKMNFVIQYLKDNGFVKTN